MDVNNRPLNIIKSSKVTEYSSNKLESSLDSSKGITQLNDERSDEYTDTHTQQTQQGMTGKCETNITEKAHPHTHHTSYNTEKISHGVKYQYIGRSE